MSGDNEIKYVYVCIKAHLIIYWYIFQLGDRPWSLSDYKVIFYFIHTVYVPVYVFFKLLFSHL